MRTIFKATGIVLLALAIPAAWANVTGTPTLAPNTSLNLETGATASSGGDLLWNGTTMAPQGSAGVFNLGALGAQAYGFLTQSTLQVLAYSSTPIPASTLSVGDVFAAKTNAAHYAAVLVTAVSGTSITLQFTTFGASGAASGPSITGVANNYSFTPPGFTNSGIAPSTIFTIFGSGMADPNAKAVLQSSAAGLPTTLNGASLSVTSGGKTVTPAMYYATATAIAAVLPASTPAGTAQITVTYNNQKSAAFSFQVVQTAMGFDTYYGTGSGLGIATNPATGVIYDYSHSIPPGTTVTLWGSGLGADPARDTTFVGSALAINSLAHIYVGGVDAPIGYQGASGYPGLNQVNVTIPNNAPTGCNVSLVGVTAPGTSSNFVTLPIGNGVCADSAFGTTGSDLTNASSQTNVKSGAVFLSHSVSPATSGSGIETSDLAFASFSQVTGASYGSAGGSVSIPGCIVSEQAGSGGTGTVTGLDAGTISVAGPTGNATLMSFSQVPGSYFAQLASGFIPLTGGSFQFNGSGGKDVGAFMATVTFPNPILTWTNEGSDATVNRSSGVLFTWSGGAPGTFVIMSGDSSATVSGQTVSGSFTCIAPQSALQFQVPGYVTGTLPAGMGNLTISNYTNYTSFTATGIDHGIAAGFSSVSSNATYQ